MKHTKVALRLLQEWKEALQTKTNHRPQLDMTMFISADKQHMNVLGYLAIQKEFNILGLTLHEFRFPVYQITPKESKNGMYAAEALFGISYEEALSIFHTSGYKDIVGAITLDSVIAKIEAMTPT